MSINAMDRKAANPDQIEAMMSVAARSSFPLNLIKLLFVFFDLLDGSFGLFFPLRFSFLVDYAGLGIDSA